MISGVVGFNGYNGCIKCETSGKYSHRANTMIFTELDAPKRTNEKFRNRSYGTHHKTDTVITKLPIDMIKQFPIGDALHLIDLGNILFICVCQLKH